MFTGLVEEVGTIADVQGDADGVRIVVAAREVTTDVVLGDSVAVDGACLTVIAFDAQSFAVEAVAETLRRTSLGDRGAGDRVNLERALRAGDRMGGHMVQGHVDGVGTVTAATAEGAGRRLGVAVPAELRRYVVQKGSVAIDGVSLTVAATSADGLEVALIPHTLATTTLGSFTVGRRVNLEVDLVAKYVEALVAPYRPAEDNA